MTAAVEVEDLAKHYGGVRAVDGITFSVAEGEVFGFSATTARARRRRSAILTGRARPTAGARDGRRDSTWSPSATR